MNSLATVDVERPENRKFGAENETREDLLRAIEGFAYQLYAAPIHSQPLVGETSHIKIPGALLGAETR